MVQHEFPVFLLKVFAVVHEMKEGVEVAGRLEHVEWNEPRVLGSMSEYLDHLWIALADTLVVGAAKAGRVPRLVAKEGPYDCRGGGVIEKIVNPFDDFVDPHVPELSDVLGVEIASDKVEGDVVYERLGGLWEVQ